jgi:hypothetical protein
MIAQKALTKRAFFFFFKERKKERENEPRHKNNFLFFFLLLFFLPSKNDTQQVGTTTLYFKTEREKREREERETMASAAAAADASAAVDIEDGDQKRRRRKRRSLRRESKIIGQIDIEIESNSSQGQQHKQQQYLSIRLTNKNYDDAAEMCVNFCEERGLPMKIAPALALRLRAAYKKALIKQAMDSSLNSSSVGGFERERERAKTEGEEDKEEEYKEEEEVRREKVQLLTSNPADMARRIAEIKKNNTFNKEDETTTATKANATTSKSFQMVTPSNVGSWNPVASGEMTMQKVGADATRVVRREREREREEEEINGGGDLLEVIVVDEQQQQEQHPSHGGQFELEEECASEADLEEEMLEFEITPTKQDYADSFARPSDWFVQDFEDKATLSAKKTNETFKTPSKKESDRGEGSRGSGAAVAAVAAAVVDGDDDSDTSLSEKIIHASPGFKDSLKMFEAMDAPKKKSSFVKSPTMTAPGFVSPMETKKPNPRYAPRDLNE